MVPKMQEDGEGWDRSLKGSEIPGGANKVCGELWILFDGRRMRTNSLW